MHAGISKKLSLLQTIVDFDLLSPSVHHTVYYFPVCVTVHQLDIGLSCIIFPPAAPGNSCRLGTMAAGIPPVPIGQFLGEVLWPGISPAPRLDQLLVSEKQQTTAQLMGEHG